MREKVFLQTSQAKPVKFKTLQLVLLDIHFLHEKKKEKKTDSRNECPENYDEKLTKSSILHREKLKELINS